MRSDREMPEDIAMDCATEGNAESFEAIHRYIEMCEDALAVKAELMEALGWYQKQAELCRKVTKEGDTARRALDRDGGAYALAVISKARGES